MAKYNLASIDRSLRRNIVFAPHNLAVDNVFSEFQLIVCRNVLIYFNATLQDKVIELFYDSLGPKAFLGLGNKESLIFSNKRSLFMQVDRKQKIYSKK
jgi:chemotaxis protein methyltransferase CheR